MAEQYAGWTVYAGEATEDNILGAEAANYDIEESLSHYETQVALAIQEAFPGIEVQHENYPGTLGGNAVACDAEGRPDDGVDGISATIDSIIAEVFESGKWAVELPADNVMFCRHQPDGEAYAIQTRGDEVVGICGPLHHSEIWQDNYNWDDENLDWARTELGLGHFAMLSHESATA